MITIDYFSDVLCVWAYGGQIRLDELQQEFAGELLVRQRFLPLFADTRTRIGEGWKDKGGFDAFGRQMQEVCSQWEHTRLHSGAWNDCRPTSSTTSHVFLKAVSLCLGLEQAEDDPNPEVRTVFDRLVVQTRTDFFEQAKDISSLSVLLELLGPTGIPTDSVMEVIEIGRASCRERV